MKKHLLLLTGNPGIGKTTALLKIVQTLRARGFNVGGMVSREVRSCGARVGFEILDLNGSKPRWLAHVNQQTGPRIGRYRVNLEALESLGVGAILKAVDDSDVVVIDEIGPMELLSNKFRETVRRVTESEKPVIGVVHSKASDAIMSELRKREDAELFLVTYENRDRLHEIIIEKVFEYLGKEML
ncbi:NTPase [Candidatus Bathyarchaeota archaeon]|nr:NTPase [Candidatus Bathyarchaeota archaeon]